MIQLVMKKKWKIKPVKAAGGVVYRLAEPSGVPEVLLIKRNGVWDIPKGKLEKGETIEMCAVREVAEETGCTLPVLISEVSLTYHEYEMKGKFWGKNTWWYAMILPKETQFIPQEKEGIEEIEWVSLTEAYDRVGYTNLVKVLTGFKCWYNKQP